jgi:four helix bundle protein
MEEIVKLEVYKTAKAIALRIYACSKSWPPEERYGLTGQIRRSAISIASNLAEGLGRGTNRDVTRFLYISRGSSYEVAVQWEIARDLAYISTDEYEGLVQENKHFQRLLAGLIKRYISLDT